jgi:hypothetical protein
MRLKRELREAKEEVRSTDDIYRQHLLYYARKDCLQLANMMHQKLPIELRELVYGFLCVEPDRPIPVGPYYHFRKYDQPFHDPQLRIPWPDDELLRSTWPPQRFADPNSYAAYIRAGGEVEVEIGDASGTQEHSDGSQHAEPFRLVDSNDTQMAPELTRLIMKTSISTPADRVKLHDDPDDTILPDGRVKEEHTHKPPSDMVLPYSHFLDPRYVGPAIAFETQKMYYAQNTFSVCSVEQGIFYLLNSDSSKNMVGRRYDGRPKYVPKDLELKPPVYPRDHIQNLQIRVKLEQFHSDMPQDHFSDFEKYAYERRFLRFTQQNLEGLKGFLHNRSKQRLNIEFVIMTELLDFEEDDPGWHAKCNYVNFLQSIRNWVYRMMYDCGNVSVKITHHDELQFPFPRDITGLFGLTKEQWEHVSIMHAFYLSVANLATTLN